MHFGIFPSNYEPGRSYLDPSTRTGGTDRSEGVSRRSILGLLPLVLGFAGGSATSWGCIRVFGWGRAATDSDGTDARPDGAGSTPEQASRVQPGSTEWALWIQWAPAHEFLNAAGELERVRMHSRGDVRLIPVFVRLLEVALRHDETNADQAGAIAVRCLHRLGAERQLLALGDLVRQRSDRAATAQELGRVLHLIRKGRDR